MIRENKYPEALKNARIVPLLKSGKSPEDPASYRPIANLSVIDKVIESLLKNQLESHLENEGLIPMEHHGSRKEHSTMTCKISIDNGIAETVDNKKNALVLTTDLTACFDVVDHRLILEKMKHLNIVDESIDLLENFLSNRTFIIDIQGFCTTKIKQPPCSIIQGSCFSGFLMNISALEVPLLPEIMNHPELASKIAKRKIEKTENVVHNSHSYVDDNCNVIGTDTHTELEKYTQDYYDVLKGHYSDNKLKLNESKTSFMVMRTASQRESNARVKIKVAENEEKYDDRAVKILGWWINKRMNMSTNLQRLKGIISMKVSKLRPIMKYMNLEIRKEVVYSKIGSILLYGSPLYCGHMQEIKNNLTAQLMKLNRLIYMNNTYKMSNQKICMLINVEMPDQMIKKNTLNLIHKLMIKKKPQSILNRIRENRHSRSSAKINLNLNLRTKKAKRSVLYRGIKLYNSIPTQLKSLSVKLFKKRIKKYHINEVADD